MNNENEQKIIDKIQAILSRANNNANEHEAQVAMAHAQRLLLKHGLEMKDVEEVESSDIKPGFEITLGKRQPPEMQDIASILQEHFNVRCLFGQMKRGSRTESINISFVGRKHYCEVANYTYLFLSRTYRELFTKFRQDLQGKRNIDGRKLERYRHSYYKGLTIGINDRLKAQKQAFEAEYGLVPVYDEELDQAISELTDVPLKRKERDFSHQVALAGMRDAEGIALNTAIDKAEDGPCALEATS